MYANFSLSLLSYHEDLQSILETSSLDYKNNTTTTKRHENIAEPTDWHENIVDSTKQYHNIWVCHTIQTKATTKYWSMPFESMNTNKR